MMNSRQPGRKQLLRRRKLLFTLVLLVSVAAVVEGVSWMTLGFFRSSLMTVPEEMRSVAKSARAKFDENESLHPYLGWVLNPDYHPGSELFDRSIGVNSMGLNDIEHGDLRRSEDEFILGIAGGSVAWQLSVAGEKAMRDELRKIGVLGDRRLKIVRLAMSGYKQPQQLLGLTWFLSLGMEFDAVVNVDGFNEAALTTCENLKNGIYPSYPRMWQARMQDVVDPGVYSLSFRLLKYRAERQQLAQDLLASPLIRLAAVQAYWCLWDRWLISKIVDLGQELVSTQRRDGLGFAARGPSTEPVNEPFDFTGIVEMWSNCSLQMDRLCRANGILYLHVLQPNQYLPGSKPFTEIEKTRMITRNQCNGNVIAECFPLMIEEGDRMRSEGLSFVDMTKLFITTKEQVYQDPCCHLNERGNRMLGEAVADELARELIARNKQPSGNVD